MQRKIASTFLAISITFGLILFAFLPSRVASQPAIVYVDDDNSGGPWDGSLAHPYQNITSGLEHAGSGDTLYVFNGVYVENVFVDQSVSIVGEDPVNTIVDGNGTEFLSVIHIDTIDNIVVRNLTVRNTASGFGIGGAGIFSWQSNNITVADCTVTRCYYGLILSSSNSCRVFENMFVDNYAYGIDLRTGCCNNSIISNLVADNPTGIYIEEASSQHNLFYRNNVVNNTNQVTLFGGLNFWDNGAEGNYWDDYSGSDLDGDGVGDSPYFGVDWFPLMEPWSQTRIYTVDSKVVSVTCNYTVASFEFNGSRREISFYITGPSNWEGFCNVTIPTEVLKLENASEKWLVMLGSNPMIYHNISEGNSTIISFEYTLGSSMLDNRVRITVGVGYPPTADFNLVPDKPIATESTVFNDISIPGNGAIIWRYWDFGDGTFENTTELTTTHSYTSSGNCTVTLTVLDTLGLTDSVSKTVMVIQHPTANFTYSPLLPLVDEEVSFDATNSASNGGTILSYYWMFGDGANATEVTAQISHIYMEGGTYEVSLTVLDSEGLSETAIRLVEVLIPPNVGFSFSPTDPVIDETVTFNASSSFDPDGTITTYIWIFGDGSPIEEGQVVTHSFSNEGSYEVTLTVYDEHGVENTTARTVTISIGETTGTGDYVLFAVFAFVVIAIFCVGFFIWRRRRSEA